eukprot:PITA_28341
MVDEMASLQKNEAWDLVELQAGRKPIGRKWVFKKKTNAEGKVEKYKSRLVAKGYSQVEQMDVKTTFIHGDLEKEIYMKQPEGFVVKGKKELVCKLKKSMYGLKQSPRMWYQKFDTMRGLGFTRRKEDHCVYFKLIGDRVIYLVLYVDDMLLVGNNKEILEDLKTQLSSKFNMKDLGAENYILGMDIKRDRAKRKLWLNQSKFRSKPGKEHWIAVKQVFRYLCGTSDHGLWYQGRPGLGRLLDIHRFVDADWARDLDQRISISGYVFNLFGGTVSWMSKKQSVVALSTIETKYRASTHASKEAVWLQRLCSSMGLVQGAIRIDCDNQSEIFLAKKPAYHSKTKCINVQYHFVRDMIKDKKVLLVNLDTLKNTANALTKSVRYKNFSCCRETMGILGLDK